MWYPGKKIVFTAPTRPLVEQQIRACFHIMGIPRLHITDLTGEKAPDRRAMEWKTKRVFFLTPDTLKNDLEKGICPAKEIRCLVIDECHKATGNHASAVALRSLVQQKDGEAEFRVLGLSASPGKDDRQVQQIVTNLMLNRVELRTEESPDVRKFTFNKEPKAEVVPLTPQLEHLRDLFYQGLEPIMSQLHKVGAIGYKNPREMTKGRVWAAWDNFKKNCRGQADFQTKMALNNFSIANSLYINLQMLVEHGMRTFYASVKNSIGRHANVRAKFVDGPLKEVLRVAEEKYGDMANASLNMDATIFTEEVPHHTDLKDEDRDRDRLLSSHPKLERLGNILAQHFRNCNAESGRSTRAMVFSQFRSSVAEITDCLRFFEEIKPVEFKGQGDGNRAQPGKKGKKKEEGEGEEGGEKKKKRKNTGRMTQKKQLEIIRAFKEGRYNTLVCTSVAEEGLDIGEIDLIVCYDSAPSVLSTIQRFGRTGRKRHGRIVVLVTAGDEEMAFRRKLHQKTFVEDGRTLRGIVFNRDEVRMVPTSLRPRVEYVRVERRETFDSTPPKKRRPSGSSGPLRPKGTTGQKSAMDLVKFMGFLSEEEWAEWTERFKLPHSPRHLRISSQMDVLDKESEVASSSMAKLDGMSGKRTDLSRFTQWQDDWNPWSYLRSEGKEPHSSSVNLLVRSLRRCGRRTREGEEELVGKDLCMEDVLKPGEVNVWSSETDTEPESRQQRRSGRVYFEEEESQKPQHQHLTQSVRDLAKKKVKKARQTVLSRKCGSQKRERRAGIGRKTKRTAESEEVELLSVYRPQTPEITEEDFRDLRSEGQRRLARRLEEMIGRLETEMGSRHLLRSDELSCSGLAGNVFRSKTNNDITLQCPGKVMNNCGLTEDSLIDELLPVNGSESRMEGNGHGERGLNWNLGFNFSQIDKGPARAVSPVPKTSSSAHFTTERNSQTGGDVIPPSPVVPKRNGKRKRGGREVEVLRASRTLDTGMTSPMKPPKEDHEKSQSSLDDFHISPVFNRSVAWL